METMETKVNTTNETESAAHQTGMMDINDFDYCKKRLNYSNLSNTKYSKGIYLVNLRQNETPNYLPTKKYRENILKW